MLHPRDSERDDQLPAKIRDTTTAMAIRPRRQAQLLIHSAHSRRQPLPPGARSCDEDYGCPHDEG
jgi:hypothetical protein